MFLSGRKVSELSAQDIEFIKEAAGALARCGERLETALRKLHSAERALDLGGDDEAPPGSRQQAIEHYREAWKGAEKARYLYIVQREAIGFRNHKFADRIYPLPPPRGLST